MIAWAANTSSACPLRAPVERHCVMNLGLAREAIRFISQIDVGTVTIATIASSGDTANIITVTPTTMSSDGQDLAGALLQTLGEVVDVVGDAAEQVAAGVPVDVREGKAVQLGLDGLAETLHRPLDRTGEEVRLRVPERPSDEVDRSDQPSVARAAP